METADGAVTTIGPGGSKVSWRAGTAVSEWGEGSALTLELVSGATLAIDLAEGYSCALFTNGVLPSYATNISARQIDDRLERFYTLARSGAAVGVDLRGADAASARIVHRGLEGGTRLEVDFGTTLSRHEVVVEASQAASPPFAEATIEFSDPRAAQTHLVALWGSVVGTMGGIDVPGSVYPTLPAPHRAYGSLHTFFDPDSWEVVNCLSYSGDGYLQGQARAVLERARRWITPSGQVPHHFDGEEPCYVAISGAAQPGPNLFWPMAVLDHVAATGDREYLRDVAHDLLRCLDWVLARFDPGHRLLNSMGPLWIDVFRREGFTLDTNAMAVHVLRRVVEALDAVGDSASATRYAGVAAEIASAVNQLWREDHYATALNVPGHEPMPDLIDSDDVLTVVAGIASVEQAERILARLSASRRPGARGTWVSDRRYGPDRCYGGNTGDSDCAMARLLWAELRAMRERGHSERFRQLFGAVRDDLLAEVWMGERYSADGQMMRAFGYHEYPGVIDMMQREGMFGLQLDVAGIDLRPMIDGDFSYRVGDLEAARSGGCWQLRLPGTGPRRFTFHDLVPSGSYQWNGASVAADLDGVLVVTGEAGAVQTLTA